ncbi:cation channel family protein (macronuclear) [Tetrahymena thermophila SB210]|uniref:Cation channel family protein n=1 Tax=Tetrahymena thermophila (strain SB210) TaxID=312017 RepID=I7MCG7_TETTS|nr:cation channel family protein [Tetrahymena thermophila SB210]EAR83914.2 cation channel family protein [Tetrahymena thermophila SB210]|eukprot:XP_001031577.2 cation channel family protein [Tetrahymena thermophila SB210]
MNDTEECMKDTKINKQTIISETDTFSNEKQNNSKQIFQLIQDSKFTEEEASQVSQADKYDEESYYEEQIDADDGAKQRRQYFNNPLIKIKSVEDDSVCSYSEYASNRLVNSKRINQQQSFDAKNTLNGSRNNNSKNMNQSQINNEIVINLNNLQQGQDKGNLLNSNSQNINIYNTTKSELAKLISVSQPIQDVNDTDKEVKFNNLQYNNKQQTINCKTIQIDDKNQHIQYNSGMQHDIIKEDSGLMGVWKKSSLLIITLVKKFQSMLMSHSNQNKFRALDKKHFLVIGDKSVNYLYYTKYKQEQDQLYLKKMKTQGTMLNMRQGLQSKGKKNLQYFRQISNNTIQNEQIKGNCLFLILLSLLKNVKVIQPNSRFKIIWNIVIFILLIINFFIIPLKLCFASFMTNNNIFKYLTFVTGTTFSLDTIMNFNSAYFSKGLIITDRKKIIKNYMKKNFFIDLFTLLAFSFSQFSYIYFEAGILIKILKLAPIMENFEEILNLRQRGQAILSLLKLIIFILMVTHILGCSFFLLARLEEQYFTNTTNWIDSKGSWDKEWYDQYILSLYWAVVTMITVGYGDVVPQNTWERLFCIIVMLISCGVFGYGINQIGRILEELSKKDAIFRDNISLITSYLKQSKKSIARPHFSSYIYLFVTKLLYLFDLGSLKNELASEMYIKILNDQKVFRLNFSQGFIADLSLKMKEKRLGPEELIFQERDYLDRLYFLIKGQVELFVNVRDSNNNLTTSVNILSKGRLLGQAAFFTQLPCSTGARCVNVTSLIFITRDDFIDVIRKHSKDYEKFCMLRDNIQVNHISRGLGTKCHLCGSFNHSFQSCHLVRYTPMKEKVILRYNRMEQGRDPNYVRNDRRNPTSSARIAHEYLKDTAINFLLDFNPDETGEETVLEVIENLKKYYAKEDMKWKTQVLSEKIICEDINEYFNDQGQSPGVVYDANSAILNSENIVRQISLQQSSQQQESNLQQAPFSRKKKKTLSFIVPDDLNSDSNQSNQQLNGLNSPFKRKRFKESKDNGSSSENLNNFSLQNNNLPQQTSNEAKEITQVTSNFNPNVEKPITIGGFLKQKSYMQFKTTSSRPQEDSLVGNNSDLISNHNQAQTNLLKSTKMIKRRNNIIGGVDDEAIKKNSFCDIIDFDRYMIFEIYFVEGNINKVLEHYNNYYIHLKKEENDLIAKKRNHLKRMVTKRKLTKSERSMNILKNKIIQKRSQNGKHGTYYTQNIESPTCNFSVKSGKTLQLFRVGGGGTDAIGIDSSAKNQNNLNQGISFNDYLKKNEISKSANIIFSQSGAQIDSSDKQSDKPPNFKQSVLSLKN